jgi:hypothetical protein
VKGYRLQEIPGHHGPMMIPGFPGVWTPGEAKSLQALGLEENEAADLVEETGAPLSPCDDAPDVSDKMGLTAGLVSNATNASESTQQYEDEPSTHLPVPEPIMNVEYPSSHKDLDKLAADNDYEFSDDTKTVGEKQAALAGAGIKPEEGV